ncbi:MAG: phosphoadenosine phosphosulfate reductase family protein [Candidatus Wallbacteria bacterium]|nr:phosphoadenosine phosphosulfate reductase family protein [Candidatus Wallbacteria bacterium]
MSEFYSVSMSGGKDSTALALWMREQGLPHVRIFADTGWESPVTYAYLDYLEERLGPIERLKPKESFTQRLLRLGTWPARSRRWCTKDLKVYPIRDWMDDFRLPEGYTSLVNVVGIRAEESAKRATFREREWSDDTHCYVWRPLLRWSLADVLQIHRRHGVKVNPLYQQGFERVGCFPCIYAGKLEIRLLAEEYQERIDVIRDLERATGNTMFALRRPGSDEHIPTPIDDAVIWSKTVHGGTQLTLVRAPSGCARWGLCETAPKDGEDV